ncbi:FeS assembly protein SufD [mine drainage metagenome]|uniref:FeS assembly protein SufD n=1 Tax=mine drainage metagenome TaxID=410659 RepID=T1AZD1_9ZZZZ
MMSSILAPLSPAIPPGRETWEEWLGRVHAAARDIVSAQKTSARDENWKYTRQPAFRTATGTPGTKPVIRTGPIRTDERTPGRKWDLLPLSKAYALKPDLVTAEFGRMARPDARLMTALNAQAFEDGVFLYIPPDRVICEPIEIVWTLASSPAPAFPRILIVAGAGSDCQVIERQVWNGIRDSADESAMHPIRVVNSVTEIHLERQATLTHYVEQQGDPAVRSVSLASVRLDEHSFYRSFQFDGRGTLLRHEQDIRLEGAQSHAQMETLTLLAPREHCDRETRLVHAARATRSEQRIRSVVGAQATSIYGGRVRIQRLAAGSEATQDNHHLLLDPTARAMSRPELEIATDDVRCTHGSRSGELDRDALFYLQSRGIDLHQARHLLIQGFTEAFLALIPSETVRIHWQETIARLMPGIGEA